MLTMKRMANYEKYFAKKLLKSKGLSCNQQFSCYQQNSEVNDILVLFCYHLD